MQMEKRWTKRKKNRKREKGEKGPPKKTSPVSRKQTKKCVIGQNCVKQLCWAKKIWGYRTNYCLLAENKNTLHWQRVNLLVFWPNLIHPLLISPSTSARFGHLRCQIKYPLQPWKQINQCDLLYNLSTSITTNRCSILSTHYWGPEDIKTWNCRFLSQNLLWREITAKNN